jgi:hypothetical protein
MPVQGPAADVPHHPSMDKFPLWLRNPWISRCRQHGGEEFVNTESQAFEAIPTTFETRNLGITLEIEPIVSTDGRTIDLSLVPQHVCLLGMRKTEIELKSSRKKVVVEQPEIMSIRLTTSLQVKDGEHTLLGVFKINGPVDHMEFFILHTQLKRIEVTR